MIDGRTVVYPGILSLLQEAIDKCPQAAEKSSSYIDTYDMFWRVILISGENLPKT